MWAYTAIRAQNKDVLAQFWTKHQNASDLYLREGKWNWWYFCWQPICQAFYSYYPIQSQCGHLLAVLSWARYLKTLCVTFLIFCKSKTKWNQEAKNSELFWVYSEFKDYVDLVKRRPCHRVNTVWLFTINALTDKETGSQRLENLG